MAKVETVEMLDDLDGTSALDDGVLIRTVEFGVEGRQYEIDLSEVNANRLLEVLAPFTMAARKAGQKNGRSRRARTATSRPSRDENAAIRAWARKKRIKLADRGRIPNHVIAKYREAQAS